MTVSVLSLIWSFNLNLLQL